MVKSKSLIQNTKKDDEEWSVNCQNRKFLPFSLVVRAEMFTFAEKRQKGKFIKAIYIYNK